MSNWDAHVPHLAKHMNMVGGPLWWEALGPVSSEISDFTPCTHAQSNIKTDYQGLGIRV